MTDWYFFTNHALVLLYLARDPQATLRQIALAVGITERAVAGILRSLEANGYVRSQRIGRRKRYMIDLTRHFRHPLTAEHTVRQLLDLLERPAEVDRDGHVAPAVDLLSQTSIR